MIKKLVVIIVFIILPSCGPPKLDIKKSDHFDGKVFYNLDQSKLQKSFKDLWRWRFQSKKEDWPKWVDIKQQKILNPRVKKGELSIAFINHATTLIQIDGINILTDPVYSKRTSPLSFFGPKRVKLPGIKFEDLPKIDVVLISHNHYDSFDVKTLDRLIQRDNPKILFGLGNSYYLNKKDKKNTIEMDWQDKFVLQELTFIFLPAKHWSKRGLFDANKSLWGAFAIIGSKKIYFAGDTGYSNHFRDAQKQFKYFDLSLIPIGAYKPRWFMKEAHMNPEESVMAHIDLNSQKSIGMHFGTFQLTNEKINDPIKDLEKAQKKYKIPKDDFLTLGQGKSYFLR
jgi:L-ascorbate metabolism protein UlaG (beta-lactamase superfamily)